MATPKSTPQGASTPLSSNRITQEKEDLRKLNDELVVHIDKVRSLKEENANLRLRITESETEASRELTGLKDAYEPELADARAALDSEANERARLQLEVCKLREEYEELKTRNTTNESDLAGALQRLKNLEASLNSMNASLTTTLRENRNLEEENRDLKTQIAKLDTSLGEARTHLQREMLKSTADKNQNLTRNEALDFQNKLHSDELREVKRRHESRMVELDNGHQQDFKNNLADALKEMRSQHELQVKLDKEELEETYKSKLEGIRRSAEQISRLLAAAHEKLQQSRIRLESVQKQLAKDEIMRRLLGEKDEKMAVMQQQLDEYQELMGIKRAQDMKIGAFINLLEDEEESCSDQPPSAKRRRTDDTDSEASTSTGGSVAPPLLAQQASASGRVTVDEVDQEGKHVRLSNKANEDQDLGNWQVRRQVGSSAPIAFKFPVGFILKAGQKVTIWAGDAGGNHSPPSDLVWEAQANWGTGDQFQTTLISENGEEMAMRKVSRGRR
ncbi:prelamin-A/C-like [Festucalex cinctus]